MTTETHTQHDEAQQVADAEAWLDTLDPATQPSKDAKFLREIAALCETIATAERELRSAVKGARDNGDSWSAIGLALGTSRQAAFQRFGDVADDPPAEVDVDALASWSTDLDRYNAAVARLRERLPDDDDVGRVLRETVAKFRHAEKHELLLDWITGRRTARVMMGYGTHLVVVDDDSRILGLIDDSFRRELRLLTGRLQKRTASPRHPN